MDLSTIPAPAWVVIGSAITGLIALADSWIRRNDATRAAETAAQKQIEAIRAEALAAGQRDAAETARQYELNRLGDVIDHADTVTSRFIWLARSWSKGTTGISDLQRSRALRTIEVHLTKLRLRAPDMALPDPDDALGWIRAGIENKDVKVDWYDSRLVEYQDAFEKAVSEYVESATAAVTTEPEAAPNAYPTETPE